MHFIAMKVELISASLFTFGLCNVYFLDQLLVK